MIKITMLVASATLLAAACGGGASTDAASVSTAEAYCEDGCVYQIDCDPTSGTTLDACVDRCVDEVAGLIREDVLIDITACMTSQSCDESAALCRLECEPTGSHDAYATACRANLGQCDFSAEELDGLCSVTPSATSDDVGYLCFIAPAIIDELTACFDDGTCQSQLDCLQAVVERTGIDL